MKKIVAAVESYTGGKSWLTLHAPSVPSIDFHWPPEVFC